jgi:steroid delta-isomerase-like uncharacterized protein
VSDNKAIVRSYIDQVWTKHNLTAIDEYIAPDYLQHARNTPPGRDGVKAFFGMMNGAFSDVTYSIGEMIAEGDKVAWTWVIQGKHTGNFQGMPATGKTATITGMSLIRFVDGKLAESWGEQDLFGLIQQLRG